jgi:DNA-binding response OmpR family regulator
MNKKILMIDDDSDFRTAVRSILENAGYACVEADSARHGLKLAGEEDPDLILLDVMMEDISSGFRFVKERLLTEDTNAEAHIPILMLTSIQKLTSLNFRDRIMELLSPSDGFLDKPVDPGMLLERVDEMIRRKNAIKVDPMDRRQ